MFDVLMLSSLIHSRSDEELFVVGQPHHADRGAIPREPLEGEPKKSMAELEILLR